MACHLNLSHCCRDVLNTEKLFCAAVFTQGDRGLQVTGVFLVFAVGLHLIEAVRNSAQKKANGKSKASSTGAQSLAS